MTETEQLIADAKEAGAWVYQDENLDYCIQIKGKTIDKLVSILDARKDAEIARLREDVVEYKKQRDDLAMHTVQVYREAMNIIELAKRAGMTPVYGCKSRHDLASDECPCDEKSNCTQKELVGFKIPQFENLAVITKFAELLRAQAIEPIYMVVNSFENAGWFDISKEDYYKEELKHLSKRIVYTSLKEIE